MWLEKRALTRGGYMYYVLNVLMTLGAIASSSFTGYLLQAVRPASSL